MKTFHLPCVAILLALSQLSPLIGRAQTTVTGTLQSGGLTREYRLYVPAAYRAGTPVPLLFNLHGYGSSNVEQEAYGDFRPIADTANFLVVHPNGAVNVLGARDWNTFTAPGSGGVDDVAFLSALLTDIQSRYSVDANRVYSTGMSNGGFMSYELACKLSPRIAAVASVTGSITTARLAACTPQHPTPVLQIHGTADATVPYNGATALCITFAPIPTVLSYWVQFNGCNPTPVVNNLPNPSATDFSTVERSVWSGGRQGSVVAHLRVIGGGHTWPGASLGPGFPPQSASNPTNQDISASAEVWRFLRPFRLNRLLAPPRREMRLPRGGHVANVYVSEGQRVSRGEVLLKLTVGTGEGLASPLFVVAPAAGEVTRLRVGVGPYLAAGTCYALLVASSPALVQVTAAAAAVLRPGDSVTVVAGPPGLAGRCSVLGEVRPSRAPSAVVLTLPNLRWPPSRPAALTLAVLLRPPAPVPTLAAR